MSRPSWLPSVRRLSFAIVFALLAAVVSIGAVASAAPAEKCTGYGPTPKGLNDEDVNLCIKVEGNTVSGHYNIKPGSFMAEGPPEKLRISIGKLKDNGFFEEEYNKHEGDSVSATHLQPGRYQIFLAGSIFLKRSKVVKVTTPLGHPLNCPAGACRR